MYGIGFLGGGGEGKKFVERGHVLCTVFEFVYQERECMCLSEHAFILVL